MELDATGAIPGSGPANPASAGKTGKRHCCFSIKSNFGIEERAEGVPALCDGLLHIIDELCVLLSVEKESICYSINITGEDRINIPPL